MNVYKIYTTNNFRTNLLVGAKLFLGGSNDAFKLGLKLKQNVISYATE